MTHEWKFVVDDQFLQLSTRSVSQKEGQESEIHEDIGFLSLDTDTGKFVFRQFLSVGFVNTFDLNVETDDAFPSSLAIAKPRAPEECESE